MSRYPMSRYNEQLAYEAALIARGHQEIARELAAFWTRLVRRLGF